MKKNLLYVLLAGVFFSNFSQAQISYNMESWYSLLTFSFPNGWAAAINPFTGVNCVSKDSIVKFQGNYSAKITTNSLSPNSLSAYFPDTSGFLLSGTLNIATQKVIQGFPYTSRDTAFGFLAKYAPSGNDEAFAYVALSKWNASGSNSRDTIGSGRLTISPSSGFQPAVVNIVYNPAFPPSTLPDTAYILISSSKKSGGVAGSTLWVDALQWNPPISLGIGEQNSATDFSFYPQPCQGEFRVKNPESAICRLVLTDISGKICEIHSLQPGENLVKSELSSGLYHGSIFNQDGYLTAKGKCIITK